MNQGPDEELQKKAAGLRRSGRYPEAIAAYQALLALQPERGESWYNLGWSHRQEGQLHEALEAYAQALARNASAPEEIHLNRASILSGELGRYEEAEADLIAALALNPAFVPALLNLGNLHEDMGRREAALESYRRALDQSPDNRLALARMAGVIDPSKAGASVVQQIRDALNQPRTTSTECADLGFALGRLLDQMGHYDEAFTAYAAANRANRIVGQQPTAYDARGHERFVDSLKTAFAAPNAKHHGAESAPLFICGMFRSGSSLAEQILASHSQMTAGGELNLIPSMIGQLAPYPLSCAGLREEHVQRLRDQYRSGLTVRGLTGDLITDKRPDNFLHIGLIKTIFPTAKIIHTRRDPLDNILSLYFLQLNPTMSYAHDLEDAAHWYRQYLDLMTHWQALYPGDIFDLDYDQLVRQPRETIAALLQFCGLEWEETVLEFNRTASAVRTPSAWQVREPLYTHSSGRWRNYEKQLIALRTMIDAA